MWSTLKNFQEQLNYDVTKISNLYYPSAYITQKILTPYGLASQTNFYVPPSVNIIYELSRGEVCVGNFTPPANGASKGNYFLQKSLKKLAVFEAKTGFQKSSGSQTSKLFMHKTIYGGMQIFSFIQFCYLPSRFAHRG